MSQDEAFDTRLAEILTAETGDELLEIPGLYEVASKHYNAKILKEFDEADVENQLSRAS